MDQLAKVLPPFWSAISLLTNLWLSIPVRFLQKGFVTNSFTWQSLQITTKRFWMECLGIRKVSVSICLWELLLKNLWLIANKEKHSTLIQSRKSGRDTMQTKNWIFPREATMAWGNPFYNILKIPNLILQLSHVVAPILEWSAGLSSKDSWTLLEIQISLIKSLKQKKNGPNWWKN